MKPTVKRFRSDAPLADPPELPLQPAKTRARQASAARALRRERTPESALVITGSPFPMNRGAVAHSVCSRPTNPRALFGLGCRGPCLRFGLVSWRAHLRFG